MQIEVLPYPADKDRYVIHVNGVPYGNAIYGSDAMTIFYWLDSNLQRLLDALKQS